MIDPTTNWIALHSKEIFKKFSGQYIAIVNQKVIASASTSTKAIAIARKVEPNKEPVLMKVPSKYLSI